MNGLSETGAKALAGLLRVNSTIEELDVTSNRINDKGAVELGKGLTANASLRHLKVEQNAISLPQTGQSPAGTGIGKISGKYCKLFESEKNS